MVYREIRHEIKIRDWLKKHHKIDEYKKQRNHVTFLIRKSKRQFYNQSVKENASVQHLWNTLNALTKPQTSLTLPTKIRINNKDIENVDDILEEFNNHFINISHIVSKRKYDPHIYQTFETFLNKKNRNECI